MMIAMHPIIGLLAPEIILLVGATSILLLGLSDVFRRRAFWLALASCLLAAYVAWRSGGEAAESLAVASLNAGPLVWYTRLVTLMVGALILLVNRHVPEPEERGEFFALILFSFCGLMLVPIANNLILLFLALELVSVPTYILIGLSRRDITAQEATGKYFFLGAFAAALTLYGFSFLYGACGTMTMFGDGGMVDLLSGRGALSEPMRDPLVITGLLLALGGLAFKIAAVPFHFYVADVYQGAASPVTGMLGFVPKFAGFIAIIQLLALCSWRYGDALFWLLWFLAVATMCVGNTLALMQHNAKRMLAYSSVAHSGYMLVALVAGPSCASEGDASPLSNGVAALLFYMAVYGVMNLGAFAALSFFRKSDGAEPDSIEMLDDLAGSARRNPWASLALAACVLGLMGFPLTGGFFGKLYVFSAAMSAVDGPAVVGPAATATHSTAMLVLVIIGVLNAAIGAAYYLRILASCYLREPAKGVVASPCRALKLSLGLCALFVLAAFVRPTVLFEESEKAAKRPAALARTPDDGSIPRQIAADRKPLHPVDPEG